MPGDQAGNGAGPLPWEGKPPEVARAMREAACLEYRAAGVDYATIARLTGYANRGGAWKAVNRSLRRHVAEASGEARRLEMVRLDRLQRALWQRALAGELGAVDRVLKVMERRAALAGIDAPIRFELFSIDELDAEIQKLERQLDASARAAAPAARSAG